MLATETVLLVMTLDVILITNPTSSSTGIFILTRFDWTVSGRELMFLITLLGKKLSMSTSRTLTGLWNFFHIVANAGNMVIKSLVLVNVANLTIFIDNLFHHVIVIKIGRGL